MPFRPLALLHLIFPICLVGAAHAQALPDAGAIQRETERTLHPLPPPAVEHAAPPARPMEDDAKATRITVRQNIVVGASLIPTAELEALLSDLPGHALTLADLESASQRITRHYRERNWFARVYLPQQDVTNGTVRIQVVEGRYGGVQRDGTSRHADEVWVERVVTGRLAEGEPLSAADLERGLLLANDLAGIRATGVMRAGDQAGTTRLHLLVEDTPRLTGNLALTNDGIKATGRTRLSGGLTFHNLSGRGDSLALRAVTGERLGSALLGWQTPISTDGWRLGIHASHLQYTLGDRFKALNAQGRASTAGAELRWAWLRQSNQNLSLYTRYEHRRYKDQLLDTTSRLNQTNTLVFGLQGDRSDTLGGAGINWGNLQFVRGHQQIHDTNDNRANPPPPRSYTRLSGNAGRQQSLGSNWQLHATLHGQWAEDNLDASEKFVLGGPHGVRAWPVNEGSGDLGLLLKIELQRSFSNGWQAIAFYDTGRIRQHKHPWTGWDGGTGQPNYYSLSGAGFGLNWTQADWKISATAAFPIGGNSGKGAEGRNNDGSKLSAVRGWISLVRGF